MSQKYFRRCEVRRNSFPSPAIKWFKWFFGEENSFVYSFLPIWKPPFNILNHNFLEDFKLFRINHWLLLAFKKYFENGKKIVQLTCTVEIQSCLYGWNVKVFDRLKLLGFISTDGIFDRLVSLPGDILIINNECLVIWDQILSNLLIFHYLIEEI